MSQTTSTRQQPGEASQHGIHDEFIIQVAPFARLKRDKIMCPNNTLIEPYQKVCFTKTGPRGAQQNNTTVALGSGCQSRYELLQLCRMNTLSGCQGSMAQQLKGIIERVQGGIH